MIERPRQEVAPLLRRNRSSIAGLAAQAAYGGQNNSNLILLSPSTQDNRHFTIDELDTNESVAKQQMI